MVKKNNHAANTTKRRGRSPRSPAIAYLHSRYVGDNLKRRQELERERTNLDVARQIHELRTEAGLTMKEFAKLVGTSDSAIARLENADYQGHSLAMLRRIAAAFGKKVQVRFVSSE